jgi:formate dehydrogenase major subunit
MFPIEYGDPAELPDAEYPMILTTGRVIFHYHTGTMTRRSKHLDEELSEGFIEIHPEDAKEMGIKDKQSVKATTRRGEVVVKARITPNIKRGVVFMPFHFAEAAANTLTNPAQDPNCKIPEYKVCAVKIEKA